MPKTSTNNLMYATYLRSKGFKLIKCQVFWVPYVLFTLEGKNQRLKVIREEFNEMELEEVEKLSPFTEMLTINGAHLREAYRQQRKAFEKKASHD